MSLIDAMISLKKDLLLCWSREIVHGKQHTQAPISNGDSKRQPAQLGRSYQDLPPFAISCPDAFDFSAIDAQVPKKAFTVALCLMCLSMIHSLAQHHAELTDMSSSSKALACLSHSAELRMSAKRMHPLLLLYAKTLHCCGWNSAEVITCKHKQQ
jgi:hypothetical protein